MFKKENAEKEQLIKRVAELEAQIDELTKDNEQRDRFFAQLSHEIRTPLNSILGLAGVAKDEQGCNMKMRDYLCGIEDNSRVMLNLMNDIFDVYNLKSNTLVIDSQQIDLKDQISNYGIFFYEQAKRKNVHFSIKIKGVTDECVIGDEKRVNQILRKMMSNSLRYAKKDGNMELSVVQASDSGDSTHMRFTIKYTGESFFDPDKMLASGDDLLSLNGGEFGGSGIELAICRKLLDMMGGIMTFNRYEDELVEIVIDIPFKKTSQRPEEKLNRITDTKCMVLSGSSENCEIRGDMIENMGLCYEGFTDSDDALDRMGEADEEGRPFKIFLIDCDSEAFDAEEVIKDIRMAFGNEVIIIATTYNAKKLTFNGENLGANYVIDNVLFRSTLFDSLMMIEKGEVFIREDERIFDKYDFTGKRILVAEDVSMNMEVIVRILSKVNVEFICAENGLEAYNTYKQKPAGYFDCIFMDVNMPVMDGYEATRKIRQSDKEDAGTIPIYAMTANAFASDISNAMDAGMNGHIAKPIEIKVIYRTLDQLFYGVDAAQVEEELIRKAEKLQKQNEKLRERAETDRLTGLLNRYAFEKRIAVLRNKKTPMGFMLIDIDFFKNVNDTYGHEVGDKILIKLAGLLHNKFRKDDYVVRFGGDEFVVVIQNFGNNKERFVKIIDSLNEELSDTSDGLPAVTISAGVVFSDIGYTSKLYQHADKALYLVKNSGRRGCAFYEQDEN